MPTNPVNILGRRTNGQPVAVRCDNVGRIETAIGGAAGAVDVTDRAARLLGVVSGTIVVTDRAGRDIGKVDIADIDGFASVAGQTTMAASFPVVKASDQTPDWIATEAAWATIINNIRLDDDPTSYNSSNVDCDGWASAAILIDIDSTLAPTDVRFIAQFSEDAGTTWWDYEEGLWASLYWEDTATASGVNKALILPVAGFDLFRIRAVATGTNAGNFFDVTVKVRCFRGAHIGAHA